MKNNKLILSLLYICSATFINAEVLVFSSAYKLALENANAIKASVYMVESSKERVNQEESRLYPQVNLSAYYKKSKYGYYNENTTSPDTQGLINYGVSLKQSVYNAQIYSKITMETSRSKLTSIGVELEKEELAQTVFQVYLDLLKAHNKIDLYELYLTYTKSRLDELEKKYEMFTVSKMDILEIRTEYKSAQIDLNKENKLLKVKELKLKQLIGNIEYELPIIESDKSILANIEQMKISVLDKVEFPLNLELLQATLALRLSKEEVDNSFDGHYPTLDLEISSYNYDTDDPTIDAPYKNVSNAMLYVNVPVYSGGATSAKVRESKFRSLSANEELLNTKKDIKVRYDENVAIFEASFESVAMYQDAYESSILYVRSIEEGYKHGLKSIIDLNDAKVKQYEVRYKYIENIYELVDSYIALLILTNDFESIKILDNIVQ